MAIDLNTVPEGGEELPDLNKKPDEHEEDHNPFEDVVDSIEVGGSGRFGLHPDQIHEPAEIHQGKNVCLYPNLSVLFQALSHTHTLPLLKLVCWFISVLKIISNIREFSH